ncbi:MAG: phage tail sheath subtilisin-like domain-containing protein [Alphaproteobacteria bacterium]|nr:MAG: phage tail sheath subtilisin-like domain-containing protein [Alphaproteobacteria bacterium]
MTVPFNNIPSNIRLPLFYAEMDNSQAGYFAQNYKTLLIGQKLTAGVGISNKPVVVGSESDAINLCGRGSMLARMYTMARANDPLGEIWILPLDEPGAGVAATGTIAISGTATSAGVLSIYIAGQRVQAAVASGDTATVVATALAAAINAAADLPVTASSSTGTVTVTARWKGETGNDIMIQLNYRGLLGGERTPPGVTATITAMASGASAPTLSSAIAALGDLEFDFIAFPFTDTTSLDALKTEMSDTTGRWSYLRQIYGHVYSAKRGTLSALTTFSSARNDQHASVAGIEASVPTPSWEVSAAFTARSAVFQRIDPARPTQTGELTGVLAPIDGQQFISTERQSLLNAGIATLKATSDGVVRIERAITTYQKNLWNQADPSYLDSETLHTSAYVLRFLRQRVTQKYARHKLANDGTRFGEGAAIVTPAIVKGELISAYRELEFLGIVENADAFKSGLIVERPITDPNRLDVLMGPDYVNQLRVFAVLNQFRLQYPAALAA